MAQFTQNSVGEKVLHVDRKGVVENFTPSHDLMETIVALSDMVVSDGTGAVPSTVPSASTGGFANCVAVGHDSSTTGGSATAVGDNSTSAVNSVAVGNNASAPFGQSVAVGNGASVTQLYGVAIGENAVAGSASVVIGKDSTGNAGQSIAVGFGNTVTSNIAIGTALTNTGTQSVVLGNTFSTAQNGAIIYGVAGIQYCGIGTGYMHVRQLPAAPGASGTFWYDAGAGNVVKYVP